MRLQVLSDLHLEMTGDTSSIPVLGDVLVVAGDLHRASVVVEILCNLARRWKHVVYVPGNHEYWGISIAEGDAMLQAPTPPNVHVLNRQSTVIEGRRFVGCTLWSHPQSLKRCNDAYRIKGCTRDAMREWNVECRQFLSKETADVVVTHFMPVLLCDLVAVGHKSPYALDSEMDSYFGNAGIDLSRGKLWIFGHTHTRIDAEVRGARLVCNPVGYPCENTPADCLIDI